MKLLANILVKKLRKKNYKISVAESCTGGLLSSIITSVPGSSKVFSLGMITYSNQSKINLLNVSKKIINNYGSVSRQCCSSMVKNLNKISKTNVSLSITGIAGPSGGTSKKPVGLVYVGLKKNKILIVNRYHFKNKNRLYIQKATVIKSINLILSVLK